MRSGSRICLKVKVSSLAVVANPAQDKTMGNTALLYLICFDFLLGMRHRDILTWTVFISNNTAVTLPRPLKSLGLFRRNEVALLALSVAMQWSCWAVASIWTRDPDLKIKKEIFSRNDFSKMTQHKNEITQSSAVNFCWKCWLFVWCW